MARSTADLRNQPIIELFRLAKPSSSSLLGTTRRVNRAVARVLRLYDARGFRLRPIKPESQLRAPCFGAGRCCDQIGASGIEVKTLLCWRHGHLQTSQTRDPTLDHDHQT